MERDEASGGSKTNLNTANKQFDSRWIYLLIWCAGCALLFRRPLYGLWSVGLSDENTSHVLLIPFIAAWLLLVGKKKMPDGIQTDYAAATAFALPALLLTGWSWWGLPNGVNASLTVGMLALLLSVVAGFVFLFGREGGRRASFPLAFLVFAVPLPPSVMERFIYWLQAGSAAIAEFFFELSGFPVMREGFVFRLPRISIEVAQECSGIRSSIALLVLAVLISHFSFRPLWKKFVFVGAGLLMMVIKNGIRIASLTLLANYVNPDFLYGKLHHRGGIVFFMIGLGLLIPVYQLLRRGESKTLSKVAEPA